jgi:DNA-binding NarL/FixJ family response regulator
MTIDAGRAALADGRWAEARAIFEELVAGEESPATLEGLGVAARWLHDEETAVGVHERAYRLYRSANDHRGAARMALQLAIHAYNFRSDLAVARGWIQRARRLLQDAPEATPEAGWVCLFEAHLALLTDHDLETALRLAREAGAIGRDVTDLDVEMFSLAIEGLALVSEGHVREGMRLLDEAGAAATAGDLVDVDAIQTIYCYLIYACKRVRDLDRAASWCRRVNESSERWSDRLTFTVCRVHYADVLLWRGDWGECETELAHAEHEFRELNERRVSDVVVRLGELRRRQGLAAEAEKLFLQNESHPVAVLGRALLAIGRGDAEGATELVQRYLRRLDPGESRERLGALATLVEARRLAGDLKGAEAARDEVRRLANATDDRGAQALAAMADGVVAGGRGDHDAARRSFEDAVDLLAGGDPYELAQARRRLAGSLAALGRHDRFREEEAAAISILRRLTGARAAADPAGLTTREREVLGLLARGLSNQEIARSLVLSVRTVERHISNVYDKIGVAGRSARAAAASYAAATGIS